MADICWCMPGGQRVADIFTGVNSVAARIPRSRVLWAGVIAFAAVVVSWVLFDRFGGQWAGTHAVDLTVYRDGGLIVRQIRPYYDPHASAPLYDWGGYSALALKFTYTPFAAIAFALLSFFPAGTLLGISIVVNMACLVVALWCTLGALGYRDWRTRLGATLLAAAITFWLQPVVRTIYLGQVNLVLMAAIIWDMCQPSEGRWWKGFVTGITAGIKLTPLIFLPYLLITRRFREALMTVAGFVFTIVVGFIVLPSDSDLWWLHALVIKDGTRTGFIGWAGNQSLRALTTRLSGSVAAGQDPWLAAGLVAFVIGMAVAYLLDRTGHVMAAILVTALTGLLLSPISWDHHWVWVAPGVAVAGHYMIRNWRTARRKAWGFAALAAGMLVVYGAWPDAIWEKARNLGNFSLGFLWGPPNTNPRLYAEHGDQPSFVEYHWHGIWLLTGNAYILGGIALLLVLAVIGYRLRKAAPLAKSPDTSSRPASVRAS
jgi:alpha-1,2-mannosyltransferase